MVATILRDSNIVLSERQVSINKTKIEFLGAEFEDGRIILQPNVLLNLEKFPNVMTDKKILKRFLGLYQLHYLTLFAINGRIKSSLQEIEAVVWIKQECKKIHQVTLPKYETNLIVTTDASDKAWSAVLCCKRKTSDTKWDHNKDVVRYANGVWSDIEKNWVTFDKELRAIVKA